MRCCKIALVTFLTPKVLQTCQGHFPKGVDKITQSCQGHFRGGLAELSMGEGGRGLDQRSGCSQDCAAARPLPSMKHPWSWYPPPPVSNE